MAKIKYIDHEGAAEAVEAFGYAFTDGKATEVRDEDAGRFAGNRFFEIAGKAEKPTGETEEKPLKAVHHGGARFVIKQGDKIVKEGLNKAEADSFNAMSDEDKTAYVAD